MQSLLQRLLLGNAGGGGGGNPTLNYNFVDGSAFPAAITFTRASTATFFDSSGTLTLAGNDVPRIDYDPSTLAPRGLLIEEARTNLMLQSQFVSGWTASAGTLTTNVTASPDGTTNAASFIEDSTNAARSINQSSQSFTAGATLTTSLFVKQTGGATRHFRIQISTNAGTNGFRAYFNLATNSVALQTVGFGTGTAVANSATITPVGNGWYRISASGTVDPAATTASGMGFMQDTPSGGATYTGDGTSGLYIWGAQLEAGAFPTSYIPTTTTALTRSADVASVNTLSPWFNASEGTLFFEMAEAFVGSTANDAYINFSNGTTNNVIGVFQAGVGATPQMRVIDGGFNQAGPFAGNITANVVFKIANAYKQNDFAMALNGVQTANSTDTSGTVPSVSRLNFNGATGNTIFAKWIRRITYYPVRLTNAALQQITT